MDSMLAHVRDDYKGMERAHVDLQQLENLVKYIDNQICSIKDNHESFTFTDRAMCMTVFEGLRDKERQLKEKLSSDGK